ncbi:hypothetical protein ALC56_12669 [Trachymyrmex septentrionalis]|uniref:Uncharacterized protein n=1 Tax=Trachymyrmex septentrionalis TaxID=34720 RepID=A0A195EXM3_9HYME|nr:hypothetical protein ALC56_12669 [Trachymyrmex septentrionalis]
MKLDVSDVLYDSSSVSSDSGASQSSRVSHDFLSSIANTAVLPNNDASRLRRADDQSLVSSRCKCMRYVTHARQ